MDQLGSREIRRVRELGFSGIFSRFTAHDPHDVTTRQCDRVRKMLADEGVEMFQASGYRPCLVHPDEGVRTEAVRTLRAALRIAGELGAISVDTGPGSVSPNGPWAPDPYNFTSRAVEQLIKSVREAASAAEEHGVLLCLEGHQLVTLRSAEVMREVVDTVGSPYVKVDFDPANWIGLETIYETGPAIESMAAVLGDRIATAHVKDITLRSSLMVHIDHCPPGQGLMDIGALLRVMEQIDPEAAVILEAVEEDMLAEVNQLLRSLAKDQRIEVVE
ncbi:sugar phosphate isomerase/epimerase family protein [Aeromicrobium sp.]|uniref:sugar phosphate isomerase/epimerase family protein n=1 Tax=Aeromicrobium sp. TaxID=1871063 RepID=UPI002FCA3DBA